MPVFRVSKIYKKLLTTSKFMLLWDKKKKVLRRLMHSDPSYKLFLTKPDEFYILKSVE